MAKITRIDRLMFCENEPAAPHAKGAGWVVRTSDLRISALAPQFLPTGSEGEPGFLQAVLSTVRTPIEREYRILRRKGIVSTLRRVVGPWLRSARRGSGADRMCRLAQPGHGMASLPMPTSLRRGCVRTNKAGKIHNR